MYQVWLDDALKERLELRVHHLNRLWLWLFVQECHKHSTNNAVIWVVVAIFLHCNVVFTGDDESWLLFVVGQYFFARVAECNALVSLAHSLQKCWFDNIFLFPSRSMVPIPQKIYDLLFILSGQASQQFLQLLLIQCQKVVKSLIFLQYFNRLFVRHNKTYMFASTFQAVGYRTKKPAPLITTSSIEKIQLGPYDLTAYLRTIESVQKVKKQLNVIYKLRLELLPRDISSLYQENQQLFSVVLGHPSPQAAFAYYDQDGDGQLSEREQVAIFTHLLTRLYDKKMQCLKSQLLYKQHAKLLNIMSNIEDQLPQIQKNHHRLREEAIKREASLKKRQALNEFDQQIQAEVLQFEDSKRQKLAKIKQKHKRQQMQLNHTFDQTNNSRLIRAKPSLLLKNTKQVALLQRLSPYRQEKKRDYECQQLEQTIQRSIQKEQQRISHTIETHKNLERLRMRQNQKRFVEIENEKLQSKWNKMLSYMQKHKDRLQKQQDRLLMIQTNRQRKQASQLIEYTKKAAKSHRQRADSVNISRIIMEHRDIIDYGSNIGKLQNVDDSNRNYRYLGSQTIQQNREMMTLQIIQSPEQVLKSHRQSFSTRYEEPSVQKRLKKRQGSITDLYDSNLNLVK